MIRNQMRRRKSNEPRSCAKSLPRAVYAENKNSTKESAKRKYNHNYYGFVSLPFCRLFLRAWGSRQLCFRFKDSGMEEEMETWNNQKIAERIKYLREENKLTQSQVAQKLNYASRNTVSDYETGRRSVGVQVAVAYSELFGVSLDWILRGTGAFRKESKSETDELLSVYFSIRDPKVRDVAIAQMRVLAKL